ncbi:succinate dehydrogenase iron-sulfur subunit [Candidatus Woesearchaeota archaeon]|nr:succinate dehydrogenase iron-sulfur subunit [Candidatus Woesearchaeota archaeon]
MKVKLKIRKFEAKKDTLPSYKTYEVEVPETATLLDCLDKVKWYQDASLTYRRNCKNSICGSCAMNVNGRTILACETHVKHELTVSKRNELIVEPMNNMPVLRDLVVDMAPFWDALQAVEPWLQPDESKVPEKEYLQSKEEVHLLDKVAGCIMCGACFGACNGREAEEKFLGPAALARAWRYTMDSRDARQKDRVALYNEPHGAWDCTHCFFCVEVCPVNVAPMDQILKLRKMAMDAGMTNNPGARHHVGFEKIIEKSGWLDEVKLPVVSLGFNLIGQLSMIPLGVRMFTKGKMPHLIHTPIEKIKEVRDIYQLAREEEKQQRKMLAAAIERKTREKL